MVIKHYYTSPINVNTYLVHDDEKIGFLVDPGSFSRDCMDYINSNNIRVEYIILTHGHGDHIGGVSDFMEKLPDAKLLAGEGEKELLADPLANSSLAICGYPVSLKADYWLKDEEHIKVGSLDLRIVATPGHSKGGICIITEDICFSGDTLFRLSIGRTDFPESNYSDIEKSIKTKLYTLPEDTTVYPGHMGATTIGIEKKMNPFVRG